MIEPVTKPAQCRNLYRRTIKMAAQTPDIDFNGIFRHVIIIREQAVDQFLFGKNLTLGVHQNLEQAQFAVFSNFMTFALHCQMPADRIKVDITDLDRSP